MIEDAISFPTTADDWIQTVLVGGVLSVLFFLVVPVVVVYGYLVRVLRAAAGGETAPSFTDWGDLLLDGLKLIVLNLVASLVIAVPIAVAAGIVAIGSGPGRNGAFAAVAVLFVAVVAGIVGLVLGYFLPAAVANFAIEDSLAAAFDVRTVLDGALSGEYAVAWLLAIVVGFVGGLAGGLLSVLVVGVFLTFYVQVVVYYLFGRGFAAGLGDLATVDEVAAVGAGVAGDRSTRDSVGTVDRVPPAGRDDGDDTDAGTTAGGGTVEDVDPTPVGDVRDEDTPTGDEVDGGPPTEDADGRRADEGDGDDEDRVEREPDADDRGRSEDDVDRDEDDPGSGTGSDRA